MKKVYSEADYCHNGTGSNATSGEIAPVVERILSDDGRKKLNILELGCGNGWLASRLADAGHCVVGMDASDAGIALARVNEGKCRFYQRSIYDPPLPELRDFFDYVISIEVIEHLFVPGRLLIISKEYLKPSGKIILSTPYHGYLKNLGISLLNKWDSHFSPHWDGGHIKYFSPKTLSSMLLMHGYSGLRFEYCGRLPWFWKSMVCCAASVWKNQD